MWAINVDGRTHWSFNNVWSEVVGFTPVGGTANIGIDWNDGASTPGAHERMTPPMDVLAGRPTPGLGYPRRH
jgi:hypothetical protein